MVPRSCVTPTSTKVRSTAVGKDIQRALAGTGRRLTLEFGGKAANIVFADAAFDYWNGGDRSDGDLLQPGPRRCAGSRLLVEEPA